MAEQQPVKDQPLQLPTSDAVTGEPGARLELMEVEYS
jgi:hypothetical protein